MSVSNRDDGKRMDLKKSFYRTFLKLAPWEISHIGIIFPTPLYFDHEPEVRILMILGLALLTVYIVSTLLDSSNNSIYDKIVDTHTVEN